MSKKRVPEVRFEGFDDEWRKLRLGDVSKRIRGNDGRMDLPTLTISAAEGWLDQKERFSRNIAGEEQKNYTLLKKGQISYNRGNSKLAKYGVVYVLNRFDEALVPKIYHSFEVSGDAYFIESMFESELPDKELEKLVTSSARMDGLLNISYDSFMGIEISLPVIAEQELVGTYFESLDYNIKVKEKNLIELQNFKQAMLQKMFPKEGEKEPEIRFEGFSGEWKKDNLESVARIYQPRTLARDKLNDGPYPVYGANGYIGSHDEYNHQEDQVVISCRGENSGTVNFVQSYTWITGNSMVVNIDNNHELLKRFLFYLLSAQNLKYLVTGSGQPQITRTGVLNHQIFVPTKQEQIIISKFFRNLDTKIELEEENLEKLKQFKKAMLQKMFI